MASSLPSPAAQLASIRARANRTPSSSSSPRRKPRRDDQEDDDWSLVPLMMPLLLLPLLVLGYGSDNPVQKGDELLSAGDMEGSARAFERAVKKHPDSAMAYTQSSASRTSPESGARPLRDGTQNWWCRLGRSQAAQPDGARAGRRNARIAPGGGTRRAAARYRRLAR